MYLTGHLAMGYLVAAGPAVGRRRPLDVRYALMPALVGALTPDAIDKALQAAELVGHSRSLGHSLWFFGLLYLLWRWLDRGGRPVARPYGYWLAGVASHLFADLANDVFRGLEARGFLFTAWPGWPITTFETIQLQIELGEHVRIHPSFTILEIGVFALTLAVFVASVQLHRRSAVDDVAHLWR